ncbi:MAG: phytoene desaturase family protein [Chryseolinea sp.]
MKRVAVIGAGFSGLSAACFLAKAGFDVTVIEKHDSPGGRARKFSAQGFTFDMGPSWYWMPDVFEKFFSHFGKTPADYYQLVRLDPSYRVIYSHTDTLDIPAGAPALQKLFEDIEPGSGGLLKKYLAEAKIKYYLAMNVLVHNPGLSLRELFSKDLLSGLLKLHVFDSISSHVRKLFKSSKLIQLLEFPVLFLGAKPERTPSLYSLMNYADIQLGTWYPLGGMHKIIEAMAALASSLGVKFQYSTTVERVETGPKKITGLQAKGKHIPFDYVVASADYHHVEQDLLPDDKRRYDENYWNKKVLAPSSLIFYIGVNKKIDLLHHNLFFDADFALHASEIYDDPKWPTLPQFYVCCSSKTDDTAAPQGCENVFILIPVAPGLQDSPEVRARYFDIIISRMEKSCGPFRDNIVYNRSYAHSDFILDYNAYKGNAYGLANTLTQTANFKPSIVNKKLNNLFYTGQLTVPGPGVPPCIISGQVAAQQLLKVHRRQLHKHEGNI